MVLKDLFIVCISDVVVVDFSTNRKLYTGALTPWDVPAELGNLEVRFFSNDVITNEIIIRVINSSKY